MSTPKKLLLVSLAAIGLAAGALQNSAQGPDRSQKIIDRMVKRAQTAAQREASAALHAGERADGRLVSEGPRPAPGGPPNYFGPEPNWAYTARIRKFVNSLPELNKANDLGQMLTIAVPDTITFPGSDYYEIAVQEYYEKMHSDLPPTRLRGYVQLNRGTAAGQNTVDPAPIHYLGPLIVAQRNRPVRIKFVNRLPVGQGGDLFIPTDTTLMGAGMAPDGTTYTQNRAAIHLHGGLTPWISDGTPHQWITPAGEPTSNPRGASLRFVPDMWFDAGGHPVPAGTPGATNDPGPGAATYYYTNQQSARLMFYHDHAYGITRLNVYAGVAAGYVLTDPVEQGLITSGALPAEQVPLIIQDKTFVDARTIGITDPTWNWGGDGQLWFPHVYMPNQNPNDRATGANDFGRWDYGPWFWPPVTTLAHGPAVSAGGKIIPGTPTPSVVPEAFMDTPVVNGTAYPYLTVQRKAYRFRILNACNDRFLNLGLYYADPAYRTSFRTSLPGLPGFGTEVKMVPAVTHADWPSTWPTDNRVGGVPDPATAGPVIVQYGTEGGILKNPAVIPSTPMGYEYNRRNIVVLNVSTHGLLLGPAERADVVIDFSQVPDGARLILYNDAPAPVPGFDPRLDYFTGDPDMTSTGGAATTLPGYGPNTRTVLQFRVEGSGSGPAFNANTLKAQLPVAFAQSQDPLIVPDGVYAQIQDTELTFTPAGSSEPVTLPLLYKAIHELFELEYGRMNAVLGTELPFTNFNTQTTIPLAYIDPPTERIASGETQIWKITHNGVDTHAIHFHLFNVQVINRVGWDGAVRLPDENEIGWKETVRMNPLEDIFVAIRPVAPTLPFTVPDSVRLLDPTRPEGATGGFTLVDPYTGNPVTRQNEVYNFGWEYVWHCHLLGHEENDMMRPIAFLVPPSEPAILGVKVSGTQAVVSFQTPAATGGAKDLLYLVTALPGHLTAIGTSSPITVNGLTPGQSYRFTVQASNKAGISRPAAVSVTVPPGSRLRKTKRSPR
jgi:FtsP/CotA-like multicopper oxidase with cupredoxin domain